MFTKRLVNRLTFPTKHVLIVEDDIEQQRNLLGVFQRLFGHQGHVQVSVVPGALMAFWLAGGVGSEASTTEMVFFDLVLLDHDLPFGNGPELLRTDVLAGTPVITASGIPSNNDALMAAGATHKFSKAEIIEGKADDLLREILKP